MFAYTKRQDSRILPNSWQSFNCNILENSRCQKHYTGQQKICCISTNSCSYLILGAESEFDLSSLLQALGFLQINIFMFFQNSNFSQSDIICQMNLLLIYC